MTIAFGIDPGPELCAMTTLQVVGARIEYMSHASGTADEIVTMIVVSPFERRDIVVGIETPSGYIHEHARGAAVLATGNVAGVLEGRLRELGYRVLTASAQRWRAALSCGSARSAKADTRVKRMVQLRVEGWPARTNNHHRDAAGMAIYAADTARLETRRTA